MDRNLSCNGAAADETAADETVAGETVALAALESRKHRHPANQQALIFPKHQTNP
jgi:hypothetical protein